ncbi:MAG: DUF6716 putative glycosyltransferase [Pseudomonadota bacterium]
MQPRRHPPGAPAPDASPPLPAAPDSAGAAARQALLLFHDDSSLAVARAFADLLVARDWVPTLVRFLAESDDTTRLSDRQLALGLGPYGPAPTMHARTVADPAFLDRFAIVASAKFPALYRCLWRWRGWRFRRRPVFVGFFPGLELRPEIGFRLRASVDILCLVTEADRHAYSATPLTTRPTHQRTLRLHPRLIRAGQPGRMAQGPCRRIVFFTQSVVPASLEGRRHVATLLLEIAHTHPDAEVVVKLRHRVEENRHHAHVERYGYEALLAEMAPAPPANLTIADGPMESVLDADLAITCSSTAGMETLAEGIPTLFFLDFPGAEGEALTAPMRRVLQGSGLLADRQAILELEQRAPAPAWRDAVLSSDADLDALLSAVAAFRAKPPAPPPSPLGPLAPALAHAEQRLRSAISRTRRMIRRLR